MTDTFKSLTEQFAKPHLRHLVERMINEKEALCVDGVPVFAESEHNWMIPGNAINTISYVFTRDRQPLSQKQLASLKEMTRFTSQLAIETWGISHYLEGLHRLKQHGVLREAIDSDVLEHLKTTLDWHAFVDVERQSLLPNYPSNYYYVAYKIARYRELLGWGNEDFDSTWFLTKLIAHIQANSGELLYMDDSAGKGRYDRYTLNVPAECCHLFIALGDKVPDIFRTMLDKTSRIMLQMANSEGHGVTFGRSLGPHGDSSVIEILSIATYLGLFTPYEAELAYGYSLKAVQKYINVWIDKETKVVNMWDKGRKVDPYRSKERILNEDLGLCMRIIEAHEIWERLGWDEKPLPDNYVKRLETLEPYQYFTFEDGVYQRGLALVRDRGRVISLPLIGGHYQETPYLPIPSESSMLMTSPKTKHPFLAPAVILEDESRLMPVEYMQHVHHERKDGHFHLCYRQQNLCYLGVGVEPRPDQRLGSETHYTFSEGIIERKDTFYPRESVAIQEIELEVAVFSDKPIIQGHRVMFSEGDIYEVEAFNFTSCKVEHVEANRDYHTPVGAAIWKVAWSFNLNAVVNESFSVGWKIRYR